VEVQPDFRDLLALFNAHQVDYIIVGAHALAYHGAPRYTGDMDLLVRPDPDNAQRILQALDQCGFIGRKEFILNKQALGRKKDQADLEALGME